MSTLVLSEGRPSPASPDSAFRFAFWVPSLNETPPLSWSFPSGGNGGRFQGVAASERFRLDGDALPKTLFGPNDASIALVHPGTVEYDTQVGGGSSRYLIS